MSASQEFDAYWRDIHLPLPDDGEAGKRYAPMYDAARRAWEYQERRLEAARAGVVEHCAICADCSVHLRHILGVEGFLHPAAQQ